MVVLVCWLAGCGGKSVSRAPGATTDQNGQTETELCVSLCDKAKQCPDTGAEAQGVQCNGFCTAYENVAKKGGCASTLENVFACYERTDVCGNADCEADSESLAGCLDEYCTANPTDADCVALLSGF
jgi:hypothetical protein